MRTGRCRQILSIIVPMIFDEVRFCLLNIPRASSMQGKIRRQRNPLFSTKYLRFPGKFRRQKRIHGNEGNTWLNVPVETKETEAIMCLLEEIKSTRTFYLDKCINSKFWALLKNFAFIVSFCLRNVLLISKYRQAGWKYEAKPSFIWKSLYSEIRGRTLTSVGTCFPNELVF
jgi:hypothetical protein